MSKKDITSADGNAAAKNSNRAGNLRDRKYTAGSNKNREELEQAVLSQNISKAVRYFDSRKELFKYRTFRQVNGNGTQIANKLRGIDNIGAFYNIENRVLSLMQPKIRIYKVVHEELFLDENGVVDQSRTAPLSFPVYKEFKFADNFGQENVGSVQDYLAYESTRPSFRNVGFESFSIEHLGKSKGALDNNLTCQLSISFKSLKDLNAQPPGEPSPEKGGIRYVDLAVYNPSKSDTDAQSLNLKRFQIRVFLGYTAPTKESLAGLNLTKKEIDQIRQLELLNNVYTLRLVSYDLDIQQNGSVMMTCDYRGALETIIGTDQTSVFQPIRTAGRQGNLALVSQTVNAKEDASTLFSYETKINNFARALRRKQNFKAEDNFVNFVKSNPVFAEIFRQAEGVGVREDFTIVGNGTQLVSSFKSDRVRAKMLAIIRKKALAYKKDAYKSFVEQLIVGNESRDGRPPQTRLFCAHVPKEQMAALMGQIDEKEVTDTAESAAENPDAKELAELSGVSYEAAKRALEGGSLAEGSGKDTVKFELCNRLVEDDTARLKEEVAQKVGSDVEAQNASTDKKTGKSEPDPSLVSPFNFLGESYRFYYVYFGDIVELACKNAGFKAMDLKDVDQLGRPDTGQENFPIFSPQTYIGLGKKEEQLAKSTGSEYGLAMTKVLLGPIEYIDAETGEVRDINLAKYPISFNYFRNWFFNQVVNKQKKFMPLGIFIQKLVENLIIPSMGIGLPSSIKPRRTQLYVSSLTLPGKQTNKEPIKTTNTFVPKIEEMLPLHREINVNSAIFKSQYLDKVANDVSIETLVKSSYEYLLIHGTTSKFLRERSGNPTEDLQDGIYHFNIGSDRGLVNTLSFQQELSPALKNLRFAESIDDGPDSLEQLRIPYNTTVELIGTSLFIPGMYFYANPSLSGLGDFEDSTSIAYNLNLGGYHFIHTVSSKITKGEFKTTLKGTQQSQGRPR